MTEYLLLNPLIVGVSGGIIGAIIVFLTTITGILGYSKVARILEKTVWKRYGYRVSFGGALWGGIIGFVYGFLIWWVFALIYNALL
ncbi:MAG: hypothetical protein ACP5D2_03045 [Candidatus Nanoarchaeia archaeon]